jgi:CDP-paratose 2-epimerase
MKSILITGCGGLIGREASEWFLQKGFRVIGIDNNFRKYFFGEDGSVFHNIEYLKLNELFEYYDTDIRNFSNLEKIFIDHSSDIDCIIHTAAQPSHDWATKEPFTDFNINATATLNLLELFRKYSPSASFIFTSTNKVYGDNPNYLNYIETDTRFELDPDHKYYNGFNESFSVDNTTHSLFGCSKLAADVYVQEYGRYFGLKTTVFRGGCLTGAKHRGAELHGFLNFLVKCNIEKRVYNLYGYGGKQVRDNIHSSDLISAFNEVYMHSNASEVYNIGGSRYSNCSIIEAISIIEGITNIPMKINYVDSARKGDHMWWISDVSKFRSHYPSWKYNFNIINIIEDIVNNLQK